MAWQEGGGIQAARFNFNLLPALSSGHTAVHNASASRVRHQHARAACIGSCLGRTAAPSLCLKGGRGDAGECRHSQRMPAGVRLRAAQRASLPRMLEHPFSSLRSTSGYRRRRRGRGKAVYWKPVTLEKSSRSKESCITSAATTLSTQFNARQDHHVKSQAADTSDTFSTLAHALPTCSPIVAPTPSVMKAAVLKSTAVLVLALAAALVTPATAANVRLLIAPGHLATCLTDAQRQFRSHCIEPSPFLAAVPQEMLSRETLSAAGLSPTLRATGDPCSASCRGGATWTVPSNLSTNSASPSS